MKMCHYWPGNGNKVSSHKLTWFQSRFNSFKTCTGRSYLTKRSGVSCCMSFVIVFGISFHLVGIQGVGGIRYGSRISCYRLIVCAIPGKRLGQ